MFWTSARICACLEMSVVLFQVFGLVSLCFSRLLPGTMMSRIGRIGYVFALFGLGASGAFCGRHQSEFALVAGASMTLLLIGMIAGSGSMHTTAVTHPRNSVEPNLAG